LKQQLVLYSLVLAFGFGALALVHAARGPGDFAWAVAYPAAALLALPAVDFALRRSGFRCDRLLLPLTAALFGVGLATLYRLSPDLAARQSIAVCAGLVAMVATAQVASRPRVVERVGPLCGAAFLALVAAPLLLRGGGDAGPPWVDLGPVAFQPLGVASAFLVVFFASQLARDRRALAVFVAAAGVLLLVVQKDVGGAAAVLATFLGVAYVATGRLKPLALATAGFGALVLVAHPLLPQLQPRVQGWLDPWSEPAGSGYQTLQAVFALASGGLFGAGPGSGHPELVPAAHTDLTLVVVGEEWGFAGTLAVLTLYSLWTARVLRAGITAGETSSRLLAAGVAVAVGAQAFGVAAGNLRLLPLVGLPLPFLSYGGSWVLGHLALLGLAVGVSHRARVP
jgi:cell division protein FtsW (lipid II flippase)